MGTQDGVGRSDGPTPLASPRPRSHPGDAARVHMDAAVARSVSIRRRPRVT